MCEQFLVSLILLLSANARILYLRMTVAHRNGHNSTEHVQILSTFMIVEILHFAPVNEQRLTVEGNGRWCYMLFT